MFVDSEVKHIKFGSGIIRQFELNPVNELESKLVIEFPEYENGKIAMFVVEAFEKFLTTENEQINSYVSKLLEEKKQKKELKRKQRLESIVYIPKYDLDEGEREVTKEQWQAAAKVAGSYRFANESRAVVMDSDLVFINASAAMRYINARVKDCDKIYKACETNKSFLGSKWSYASREIIENIISKM